MDGLSPASLHRSVEPARRVVTPLTVCSVNQNNRKVSNSFTAKSSSGQQSRKFPNVIEKYAEKQMEPCESNAQEVSFEWSHPRISCTD